MTNKKAVYLVKCRNIFCDNWMNPRKTKTGIRSSCRVRFNQVHEYDEILHNDIDPKNIINEKISDKCSYWKSTQFCSKECERMNWKTKRFVVETIKNLEKGRALEIEEFLLKKKKD